jgi:hypothetical protein
MDKVYRIYTEDLDRDAVIEATTAKFESFTLQPTTGFYKGKPEKSIVLEIVDAKEEEVEMLAQSIRKINGQKSVLVMILAGQAKKIQ